MHHYKEEVTLVLTQLEKLGWKIDEVNNGDEDEKVSSIEEAVEKILETDESHVYITKDGKTCWLFIVLGNEPGVALADYSVNDDIEVVSDLVYDHFNTENKLPTSEEERLRNLIKHAIEKLEENKTSNDPSFVGQLLLELKINLQ